jgi:hypothetical protein
MENNPAAILDNGITQSQESLILDDHLWKVLYSHSYTILFQCENCDHGFDIDGWFYRFDSITCPKCRTTYAGFFGRILPKNQHNMTESNNNYLNLETFEGEEIQIGLNSASHRYQSLSDHIILVISSKRPEKQGKIWGILDYSEPKPKLQLLSNIPGNGRNDQNPKNQGKSKSLLAMLFGIM